MRITTRAFCGIAALFIGAVVSFAQEKTEEPKAPVKKPASELKVTTEEDKKPDESPEETWKKASARKLEIFNKLQQLKKDFTKAEGREAQTKLRNEFVELLREFEVDISPKMLELAEGIYKADPQNLDAAELVMQKAFNENQYEKSDEISAKLLAANRKSKNVVTTAAISEYAVHKFEDASALLADAEQHNKLDVSYGRYVDAAKSYIDFWKKEQEIRAKEAALEGDKALPQVAFETTKGKIVFELFEDQAPNTVANFISLVEGKKYDNTSFHRVLPGFMAQGGDPYTLNSDPTDDGQGGPGYRIACECYRPDARLHFRGSLSMAHAGKDSGGSQFFITHLPTHWLNPRTTPTEGGHTVFGRVIEGMDIAAAIKRGDKITAATVLRKRSHEYKPEKIADPDEPKTEAETNKTEKKDDSKTPAKGKEEKSKDEATKSDAPADSKKEETPKTESKSDAPADKKE